MSKLKAFFKGDIFFLLLLALLSIFVWHDVIYQTPLGEGYIYFSDYYRYISAGRIVEPTTYDNFARIYFQILTPHLKGNVALYMSMELGIMVTFYLSFYLVVSRIFNNRFFGFYSTLFIVANYMGQFDLIASGEYQRFVQRVPIIIPLLFSFYFLSKHNMDTKSISSYLVLSLVLYVVGIYLGHFAVFATGPFIIYPWVCLLTKKINLARVVYSALLSFGYIIIAYLFNLFDQSYGVGQAREQLYNFFVSADTFPRVFYQLAVVMLPSQLIKYIALHWYLGPVAYPYTAVIKVLSVGIFIFLSSGLYFVYRVKKEIFVFCLVFFLSIYAEMLLYCYVDSRLNVLLNVGQERFYFLPALFLAIVLPACIYFPLLNSKIFGKIMLGIISLVMFMYNTSLIWNDAGLIQYKFDAMKRYFYYLEAIGTRLNGDETILQASMFSPASGFVKRYYLPGDVKLLSINCPNLATTNVGRDTLLIGYDYDLSPSRKPDSSRGKLLLNYSEVNSQCQ